MWHRLRFSYKASLSRSRRKLPQSCRSSNRGNTKLTIIGNSQTGELISSCRAMRRLIKSRLTGLIKERNLYVRQNECSSEYYYRQRNRDLTIMGKRCQCFFFFSLINLIEPARKVIQTCKAKHNRNESMDSNWEINYELRLTKTRERYRTNIATSYIFAATNSILWISNVQIVESFVHFLYNVLYIYA